MSAPPSTAPFARAASSATQTPELSRSWRAFLVFSVGLGLVLRLANYLKNWSFWCDEAALALNILGRSYAELWSPLQNDQAAPVGFLIVEKLIADRLGSGEYALRLVPLLASFAAIPLFYVCCRAVTGSVGAVLGTFLVAVSPSLIYFSGELKQYSLDSAAALALIWIALLVARRGSPGRWLAFLVLGGVSVWFSYPAVFVLAGMGTTLILSEALAGRSRRALSFATVSACWGLSFLGNYWLCLKDGASNDFLFVYWDYAFLQFPPRSFAALEQYLSVFIGTFETIFFRRAPLNSTGARLSIASAILWVLGCLVLARRRPRDLALLVSPFLFAAAAAAMHKYPLRDRLILFNVCPWVMIMSAGLARLIESCESEIRQAGWVALAGLGLLPVVQGVHDLPTRLQRAEVRPVVKAMDTRYQAGDWVYVHWLSKDSFRFYREYSGLKALTAAPVVFGRLRLDDPVSARAEVDALRAHRRVWFFFSHDVATEQKVFLKVLEQLKAQRLDAIESPTASAYLYELNDL